MFNDYRFKQVKLGFAFNYRDKTKQSSYTTRKYQTLSVLQVATRGTESESIMVKCSRNKAVYRNTAVHVFTSYLGSSDCSLLEDWIASAGHSDSVRCVFYSLIVMK